MKKTLTTILMTIGLGACGTTTVIREVTPTTFAPAITQPTSKYEQYIDFVQNNSGQANSYTNSKLIETGDLVCTALDAGNSVSQVVTVLNDTASNQSDLELFAAVMYGAIQYICPEYMADLKVYLETN